MNSPSNNPSNVVPIDADERIYRNLSKDDRYGAALPLSPEERNSLIENVLAAADNVAFVDGPSSRRGSAVPVVAAAALLLLIGAGIGVFVFLPSGSTEPKDGPVRLSSSTASSADPRNRSVPSDLSPSVLSAEVLEGPRVFSPSKGIDLSLLTGARAEVLHPSASATEIHLSRGAVWAAVNPEVPHDLLTVSTEDGRVEVKGTVFYVSKDTKRSEVQVLRGLVQVTDRKGSRTSLPAGRKKDIGAEEDRPLAPADIENAWASVEAAALASRPKSDATVHDAGGDHKRERMEKTPSSEAALLGEIRQKRLSGDWRGAATLYETLIRTYKDAPSARAALISLGELRLAKLHAPKAALSLFERYLHLNEPTLAREALLGKADALKALGRKATEAEVLLEFLRRYPDAVQADPIRRRLEVIQSTQN